MASAAAVATNVSQSPLPDQEQDDVLNTTGTITSADALLPDEVDDEDDDIARPARRKPTNAIHNGEENSEDQDSVDGDVSAVAELFGSGSEDDMSPKPRQLDDEELDSGDDEGRNDRGPGQDEPVPDDAQQQEELMFMDVSIARHPIPEPSDGELYLLKVPRFLSIDPHAFNRETFQPPVTDHHSKTGPSNTFSAYNTAISTIRWRRSPSNPSQLQSNARFIRWSDGSLTLQIANDPQTQYTVPGHALVPPQRNPPKPTPTSTKDPKRKNARNIDQPYNPEQDSFTYLASPNESAQILRITNKLTASLKVEPATNATHDEALERLQMQLAAATGNGMGDAETAGIGMIHITEDPELAKKQAEKAEKEKMRAQRRREAQEQRDRERGVGPRGAGGRRGPGGAASGGLTVGGLEDDVEGSGRGAGGRAAGAAGGRQRKKPKRQNRRGEIYSDEEEEYGRRIRTREDEYDEEDDFVARSDEEEEVVESEGDEDEGIVLEVKGRRRGEDGGAAAAAGRAGALSAGAAGVREVVDAEGDVDEEVVGADGGVVGGGGAGSPVGARNVKRRRVIEEDEDEE